jgi:predicted nucleotidyltransferase
MKVLGLIVEYNPFHNGHLYHMEQSKKLSGADFIICVMSGNFIQRGEPAIVNKWARSKMALLQGADLVIELPSVYAMSSAEFFAYGAVKILDATGIVDNICFGSESGEIDKLDIIAEILNNEPQLYKSLLKDQLVKGLSYPCARESALYKYIETTSTLDTNFEKTINSSNNILGIEYLKALKCLKSTITPLTIPRISNSYNTDEITGNISSATSIRKLISGTSKHLGFDDLEKTLPASSMSILKDEFEKGRGPVFSSDFENIILSNIRKMTKEQLKALPYVSEGLENRIKAAAENSGTLCELIENISTKRYTRTRIQRSIFSLLTGMTTPEFNMFNKFGGPQYIRVLGFNNNGKYLLSHINKKANLPVIIKTADFKRSCNPLFRRMLELEAASTDMYVLAYKNPDYKKSGQEFTENVVRI